jgi:hypothetical protein
MIADDLKTIGQHFVGFTAVVAVDVFLNVILRATAPHSPADLIENVHRYMNWFVISAGFIFTVVAIVLLAINGYEAVAERWQQMLIKRRERMGRKSEAAGVKK